MKKRWLSACLLVFFFSLSAQQRLAVFSSRNDSAQQLTCISIDFFSDIPVGQLYGPVGDHFAPKYVSPACFRFDGKAKGELTGPSGIGYFGVNNEPIPPYYSHFLEGIITEYKTKQPDNDTLYVLQDAVWTYNVMDELGFIDRAATDQQEAFKKASAQYTFRYGLDKATTNAGTDSAAQPQQTILSKASQVYFNRKYTIKEIEKPDSIQFTDSTIIYRQAGNSHTITSHYHDIPIPELEKFTAALAAAVYVYIQDYRIPPERADFSRSLDNAAGYVLTFSTINENARDTMHFRVGP
jgi:hypothetical protein